MKYLALGPGFRGIGATIGEAVQAMHKARIKSRAPAEQYPYDLFELPDDAFVDYKNNMSTSTPPVLIRTIRWQGKRRKVTHLRMLVSFDEATPEAVKAAATVLTV